MKLILKIIYNKKKKKKKKKKKIMLKIDITSDLFFLLKCQYSKCFYLSRL